MVVRYYSSVAPETTLSGGITSGATVITVGSTTGFPVLFPYTLALDYQGATQELVQVESAALTTLTITRAIDGTSATSHNAGARVRHVSSGRDYADSRTHENSTAGVHGLDPGSDLVGTNDTQVLTNKSLTSPTITGTIAGSPNFTGTITGTSATTAKLRLQNASDVTLASTDHAFQIGGDSGSNLRMDGNEIQTVNNGAASQLTLNADGGLVNVNTSVAADSTAASVVVNGVTASTQFQSIRPGATTTTYSSRINGDTNSRWLARADGNLQWGPGNASADVTVSRPSPGVLNVDNSLSITNGLTVPNILAGGTSSFVNLTVTGNFNPPQTTATGATVGAVGAGWSLVGINGMKVGGTTFITGVVNRTGATLTPDTSSPDAGNITDTTMVTLTAAWRPNIGYNIAIACPVTDGIGFGGARLNTDGTLDLLSWVPNNLIQSGGGDNVRFSISFPSA